MGVVLHLPETRNNPLIWKKNKTHSNLINRISTKLNTPLTSNKWFRNTLYTTVIALPPRKRVPSDALGPGRPPPAAHSPAAAATEPCADVYTYIYYNTIINYARTCYYRYYKCTGTYAIIMILLLNAFSSLTKRAYAIFIEWHRHTHTRTNATSCSMKILAHTERASFLFDRYRAPATANKTMTEKIIIIKNRRKKKKKYKKVQWKKAGITTGRADSSTG